MDLYPSFQSAHTLFFGLTAASMRLPSPTRSNPFWPTHPFACFSSLANIPKYMPFSCFANIYLFLLLLLLFFSFFLFFAYNVHMQQKKKQISKKKNKKRKTLPAFFSFTIRVRYLVVSIFVVLHAYARTFHCKYFVAQPSLNGVVVSLERGCTGSSFYTWCYEKKSSTYKTTWNCIFSTAHYCIELFSCCR